MNLARKLGEYFVNGVIAIFALAVATMFFLVAFSYPVAVTVLVVGLLSIAFVCMGIGWLIERFLTIG